MSNLSLVIDILSYEENIRHITLIKILPVNMVGRLNLSFCSIEVSGGSEAEIDLSSLLISASIFGSPRKLGAFYPEKKTTKKSVCGIRPASRGFRRRLLRRGRYLMLSGPFAASPSTKGRPKYVLQRESAPQ